MKKAAQKRARLILELIWGRREWDLKFVHTLCVGGYNSPVALTQCHIKLVNDYQSQKGAAPFLNYDLNASIIVIFFL